MEKATSTTEVEKIKLYSHEEIVERIDYLFAVKGIRFKQIAQDAEIAQFYFMQLINSKFPKQVFQEKSQIKICIYFQKPEIKLMLKGFEKKS